MSDEEREDGSETRVSDLSAEALRYVLEAEEARWQRFRAVFSDGGAQVDEHRRMRREFEVHVQRMLTSSTEPEAMEHASWIRKHVEEVACRDVLLRAMLRRFAETDFPSLVLRVPR
jgi:hypothetical protein